MYDLEISKEGDDILEVESRNGLLLVWMDLGIGWLEQHETISKKVIELSLFTIVWQPSRPSLVRCIIIWLWRKYGTSSYALVIELTL